MNPVPLFLIILTLPLLLGGCGEKPVAEVKPELEGVNSDGLEIRGDLLNGTAYLIGSDTPYTGKSFELYDNGQKKFKENWKKGKRNGFNSGWHENGQKAFEINWKDGKQEGLAVGWHENGQKAGESNWKDGKKVSAKYWNSKGEPVDSREEAIGNTPTGPLADSIVGKVITLAIEGEESQMMFNANGVMLIGQDGNLNDHGLTYKIKSNEVLFFGDGESHGVISFSSSSPKVGDQVEFGSEEEKIKVKITKIEHIAETKAVKEMLLNPNLKYEIKDGTVTITDCNEGALGKLVIPATIEGKSVSSIGKEAFYDCMSLTSITIPDSVTSIGEYAFYKCTSLESIKIGDSVTSIGSNAFEKCSSLTSITIPDSVTSIGFGVFLNCEKLNSIKIPDSANSIAGRSFSGCTSLTNITIPDSVTSIAGYAFPNCTSLNSIIIPDSVTSVGNFAFLSCSALTAVTFHGDAPKVGNDIFLDATPTIYRKPEAKGWGETFAGRPVKLISEKP